MIHDQYSDHSFKVFASKIRGYGPEARETIKTAAIDYDEPETLPDSSFAWPEMRKFAIHNKEQAALSIIYANGENVPSHVDDNLSKVAEIYDINLGEQEKTADTTPTTSDDVTDYLLPEQKFGRISSKELVKEASEFFSKNYRQMDLETRTKAASYLVKKAKEFEARISPTFLKHAGLTKSSPKIMGEWLEVRANLSPEGAVRDGFDKLASFVTEPENMKFGSRKDMIKLADTIFELDKKAELTGKYDRTLPDPLLTVFNTSKVAALDTIRLGGKNVSRDDLLAIDPETYGDVLGADIIPEISEGGTLKTAELFSVLETLPADLQSLLVTTIGV